MTNKKKPVVGHQDPPLESQADTPSSAMIAIGFLCKKKNLCEINFIC